MIRKKLLIMIIFAILIVTCLVYIDAEERPPQEHFLKEIVTDDGMPMLLIPAGEFEMGTDASEIPKIVECAKPRFPNAKSAWFEDETPRHTVYLNAFYIDRYEVANEQYKQFMRATGHKAPRYWGAPHFNAPDQPVIGVSWEDAQAYCKWLGKRLPTEAEWERAARGGLIRKQYPWGDMLTHDNANYVGIAGRDKWHYIAPVGSFAPNDYGLYDMAGNVWEWCWDWYDKGYYARSPKKNPGGPSSGEGRVLRGGSWFNTPSALRIANRYIYNPTEVNNDLGFRCARDLSP